MPYLNGNGKALTKVGTNEVYLTDMGETNLGDIHVNEGWLYFSGNTTMGYIANTAHISGGATLGLVDSTVVAYTKPIVVDASGGVLQNYRGNSTISAGITLDGAGNVQTGYGSTLTLNGIITGTGGLTKTNYNTQGGKVVLGDINDYTGPTQINTGTLELASTGQISTASLITNSAIFQVNGGTHSLGAIDGAGTMNVLTGSTVTATSIVQGTLNIGGTRPSATAANGAGPQPSGWVLMVLGGGVITIFLRRKTV
jgi:autotransporter-associated beta strand protein